MNPKQALEQAVYNYLQNLTTPLTLNIYRGLQNTVDMDAVEGNEQPDTRVLPCVTVVAEGQHNEEVFGTLLFRGILAVTVSATTAHTTDEYFGELCEPVFAAFNIEDIRAALGTYIDDFTALEARIVENGHAIRNESAWENTIRLDVVYGQATME